jgi:hypothetical protein
MINNVLGDSPSRPSQEAPPSKLMGGGGAMIRVKGKSLWLVQTTSGDTISWVGPQKTQGTYPMLEQQGRRRL